jgi:hexosaminidase
VRDLIPATGALAWGAHGLEQAVFERSVGAFYAPAPAQNLVRAVPSKGATILDYDFRTGSLADRSGNGYTAMLEPGPSVGSHFTPDGLVLAPGAALTTPLGSKGLNHTYTLALMLEANATLQVRGPDTVLTLQDGRAPTIRASNGVAYPLRDPATNATRPLRLAGGAPVTVTFATTELGGTEAWQGGHKIGKFDTPLSQFLNTTYYA